MFNITLPRRVRNQSILNSRLFTEQDFYDKFMRDIKKAKKSVIIESPFLSEKRAIQFSSTIKKLRKNRVKVIIYTRVPRHQPYMLRNQATEAIYILGASGATVYECWDYRHRKIAIIDKTILWEGSLNILSQSRSRETMRRIVSTPLSRQMLNIIKH